MTSSQLGWNQTVIWSEPTVVYKLGPAFSEILNYLPGHVDKRKDHIYITTKGVLAEIHNIIGKNHLRIMNEVIRFLTQTHQLHFRAHLFGWSTYLLHYQWHQGVGHFFVLIFPEPHLLLVPGIAGNRNYYDTSLILSDNKEDYTMNGKQNIQIRMQAMIMLRQIHLTPDNTGAELYSISP